MRGRRGLGAAAALCLSLFAPSLLVPTTASAASDLTVKGVSMWTDPSGWVHVMGEIALSGTATSNYKTVMADCTVVDSTGAAQQAAPQPIEANILQPGEKAPFDALFPPGGPYSNPSCAATGATTNVVPDHNLSVTVTSVTTGADGSKHVAGTVTNHNSVSDSSINVILTSYDPTDSTTVVDEGIAFVDGPLGPGQQTGFDFNANATQSWDTTHYAALAEAPSPEVQLSTDDLNFGDQVKGTGSAEQRLYVRNVGSGPLHISGVTFAGSNPADFTPGPDDSCSGSTLQTEDSCTIGVVFVPQATGARSATLQVNDDANGSPNLLTLEGNGLARPSLTLSAASVDFGQQMGGTSAETVLTIGSNGLDPLLINSLQLDDTTDFTVDPGACLNAAMAAGSSCQLTIHFHPTANGPLSGTITIRSNARQDPTQIPVSGTGTQAIPAAQLSGGPVHFGQQLVNTTSSGQTLTLSSSGTAALSISQIDTTGDFGQTNNCPTSLLAGSSCTITVTFAPAASGNRAGSVVITDSAGSQFAALDGVGITETDFYFAEGYTGAGFTEDLELLMPTHSGTATIDYFLADGTDVPQAVPLTAGQVRMVDVSSVPGVGKNKEVSAKVSLPFPGIAERVMHFNANGWHGSTDIVGVTHTASEWDFAEGSTLPFFSEFLTLQNPNSSPVTVDLNYFTDKPSAFIRTITLKPTSRTTIAIFNDPAYGAGPGFGGVSVRVVARNGAQIIAERPEYVNGFSFGSGPIHDGHVAFGANAPATTWNFAEGTTLPGFNEYLTIENPDTQAATINLSYIDDHGDSLTPRSLTVKGNSRSTVEVFGTALGVGPGLGGVSVQVTSNGIPIVVERPMYIAHNFGSGLVAGASVVVGSTNLGKLFGFSALSTAPGQNDFLTIQNPGKTTANVTLAYYVNGAVITKPVLAVGANKRVTVEVFAPTQLGAGVAAAGVTVSSDEPILVEKPTYSSTSSTYGATDTLGYSPPNF